MTKETIEDLYPGSNYLNASDVARGKNLSVEITAVEVSKMPRSGDRKLVLTLSGQEKRFALNKTNALALSGKFGEDFGKWVGATIEIANVPTTFGNQPVAGLRVV